MLAAIALSCCLTAFGPRRRVPCVNHHVHQRTHRRLLPLVLAQQDPGQWTPPPKLEADVAVLLWYSGWSTVFRSAAYRYQLSGLPWKRLDQIGLDLPALNNALGEGAALAATWVAAALLTGVLESDARRYDQTRVLLTWTMAASAAQAVKYSAGWNAGDGSFKTGDAITDAAMTLVLMWALRVFEERGVL